MLDLSARLVDRLMDRAPELAEVFLSPEGRTRYHAERAIAALCIGAWLRNVIRWNRRR